MSLVYEDLLLSVLGEVLSGVSGVDGILARAPSSRANFTMLVMELEGLDKSQDLIGVTAHGWLVHGNMAEVSIRANDVQRTKREASVKEQSSIPERN